jgi:hypothetical protein
LAYFNFPQLFHEFLLTRVDFNPITVQLRNISMSDPHPKSIRGRLRAVQNRWADQCQPGDDVFVIVDAVEEIERLTTKLAATRKHLKASNKVIESKSQARTLELMRRMDDWTVTRLKERLAAANHEIGLLKGARNREPITHLSDARRTAMILSTISPDTIRAAAARLDGSPAVGTPPEAKKAAREPGLRGNDALHATTP